MCALFFSKTFSSLLEGLHWRKKVAVGDRVFVTQDRAQFAEQMV